MKKSEKKVSVRTPARKQSDNTFLLNSLRKQIEALLDTNHQQNQEVRMLREEVEGLRRDFSITMESLAELPFVSGVLH